MNYIKLKINKSKIMTNKSINKCKNDINRQLLNDQMMINYPFSLQ